MRIILMGIGAIGSVYADRLCRSEYDFMVAASKERVERYQREGILFCGKKLPLKFIIPDKNTLPADLILISVKNYSLEDALDTISPLVSEKTVMVSLMNGITSEGRMAERFPMARILYGFYIGHTATRNGNNTFQDGNYITVIGSKDKSSSLADETAEALSKAGIKIEVRENIETEIWKKFAVNVCLNQTTAYFGCTYGEITGEKKIFFNKLADEVQNVAIAERINNADTFASYVREVLDMMSPSDRSSMAQDVLAGRRTEVDDFAGEIIRLAKKHGISTPANIAVYSSMKLSEGQFTR